MYFFIFLSFFFIENAVSELVPRLRRSLCIKKTTGNAGGTKKL